MFGQHQVRLLGVTEARILGEGSYNLPSGTVLFHSGTDDANRGVALILSQSLVRELCFMPISDLLKVFIVLCYAPASSKCSFDECEDFQEEVEHRCREAPKGSTSTFLGDMNAKQVPSNIPLRAKQPGSAYSRILVNEGPPLCKERLGKGEA
ncbi:hypothetical protein GCK32_022295 [Trichostrongylus colubriformis]|uniref:Uncharacterized protein n=1 Tax=Trichostrongylus colubriformis TaxID=6319 RepID=A0AAN8FKE0_TRICO